MGDVGAVAKLAETVAGWLLSEDGYAEWQKRRELSQAKTLAVRALRDNDWDAVRERVADLERLCRKP